MKKLLIKEFKLASNPLTFFFAAATVMTMLPGYPILLGSFFVCLGIFYSFQNAREANDVIYSVLLPVKKTDFVKSKYLYVVILEAISFAVACALTALRMTVFGDSPAYLKNALMNATPFYLALVLLVFTAFNVLFLGLFFRTGWKIGVPFLIFVAASMLIVFAGEALHFFPGMAWLNAPHGEKLAVQFIILGVSALVYCGATALSLSRSKKRFEAIDL